MTLPRDHADPFSGDSGAGDDRLERLLSRRAARLQHRPGLCDRVFAAVERKLEAPAVVASIGPRRWRRALAAAALVLSCGVVVTLVLRSERSDGTNTAGGDSTLIVAEGSHAERMLVALIDPAGSAETINPRAIIDEILPGSGVDIDELDLELRAIMGETRRTSEVPQ